MGGRTQDIDIIVTPGDESSKTYTIALSVNTEVDVSGEVLRVTERDDGDEIGSAVAHGSSSC